MWKRLKQLLGLATKRAAETGEGEQAAVDREMKTLVSGDMSETGSAKFRKMDRMTRWRVVHDLTHTSVPPAA